MSDRVVSKELVVIALYHRLERLLESKDFGEYQRVNLMNTFPEYLEMMEKRRKDMEKTDHGVVFAGETSSGKSTLINKVLGKKIFRPNIHESTSTICKIRNSKHIRIIVEPTSGDTIIKDLTKICNIETGAGENLIRDALSKLTDLTVSMEGKQYRSVDISFPIPILKGNTIFVDTPGIGGSAEVMRHLMEYLPNAVSFVFVINVGSAGGMLSDRLPEILRYVRDLAKENQMPCFKPEDVIFITNKWDTLSTDDGDIEEEMENTWKTLKIKLKNEWPYLQTILKEVSKLLQKEHTSNIERQDGEASKADETNKKMQNLGIECKQMRRTLLSKTEQLINRTFDEISQDLASPENKHEILNPDGMTPILRISWSPYEYEKEVKTRVGMYIDQKLRTSFTKFKQIEHEIRAFYEKAGNEIINLKKMWAEEMIDYRETRHQYVSDTANVDVSLLTYPLFTVVGVAGLIVLTVLSPVILPLFLYKEQPSTRQKLIDEAYNKLKSEVPTKVKDRLENEFSKPLSTTICSFTVEILRVLKETQESNKRELQGSLNEILARRRVLVDLLGKVDDINDKARNLRV